MMNKQMLIHGKFVPASDGAVLESTSPIAGRLLGPFPSANAADLALAVSSAASAQKSWAALSRNQRAE